MAEKPATTVLDGKNCDILEMIEKGQEQRSPDLSKYGDYKYVARYDEVCHEYGQGSSSGAEGCRKSSLKWFRKMRCDLQTYVIGADVDADYQNDERLQNFCSLVPNDKRGILNPVPEDLYEYAFAKFPEVLDVYSILIVEYPGNKIGLYRMPEWNTRHELVYVIWCGVIQNPGFEADGTAQAFHKCTVCGQSKKAGEFPLKQVDHVRNGHQTKLQCNECSTAKRYACSAPPCQQKQTLHPDSSFDPRQIKRMKTKGEQPTLVCRSCTELGYSGGKNGTTTYQCARCRQNLGHGRFTSKALNNKQQRTKSDLYCKDCRGQ